MVSSPQTWKHLEPKALWPTLGGLAVLMHLGILGFSLPYLVEIMRPMLKGKASAIPVELIIEKGSVSPVPELSQQPSSDSAIAPTDISESATEESVSQPAGQSVSQPASQLANPATSPAASPIKTSATATTTEALTSPAESTVTSAQSQPEVAQTPTRTEQVEQDDLDTNLPVGNQETSESESVDSDSQILDPVSSDAGEPDAGSSNSQNTSSSSSDLADENTLPVIPGDRAIPTPDSESTSSDLPQTAYLKVVGYGEVPRSLQRDLVTQPPFPLNEELAEIELRPQDVGCAQLDFSQSQVTYRITVNTDGSMRAASPWTGSIAGRPPLTEEESAIACLLLASGFRFTPAVLEGEPVVNDNLLLTIDLIESQPN